jgi:hypothetical protein
MAPNGYPDDNELEKISAWGVSDPHGWLQYCQSLWHWGDSMYRFKVDGKGEETFEFLTGGWSGNESIIGAMEQNAVLWGLTWELSQRGGRHVFKFDPKTYFANSPAARERTER